MKDWVTIIKKNQLSIRLRHMPGASMKVGEKLDLFQQPNISKYTDKGKVSIP